MANTTNYNWETPDDTDLVKDGAAAIRTLGSSVDTTTKALNPSTTLGDIEYRSATANTNTRLPIGTTGQILSVVGGVPAWVANDVGDITEVQAGTGISVASGTGPVPVITNTVATAIDAAGDLLYGTAADTVARLGIGTAGQVLKVNAGATAPEWGAAAGGGAVGCVLYKSADQSINNGTWTALTFNTEEYDTDAFHDNSTNTSRITIPAGKGGKYLFAATVVYNDSSSTGTRSFGIYKNGNAFGQLYLSAGVASFYTIGSGSRMLDAVATDYFEIHAYQNSGGALNIIGGQTYTRFQVQYLGA